MRVIDRYIFLLFLRVFLICCMCLSGIYIMGDFVENLNEFIDAGDQYGGLHKLLWDYYAGRIPWFVDAIGRVAALIAGVFVVTWLQRYNEMTALMAAGLSRWRIVQPLILGAALVAGLSVVNREFVLPAFREQLSQNIGDLTSQTGTPLTPQYDHVSGVLLDGEKALLKQKQIVRPVFRLPAAFKHLGHQITAEMAYRVNANEQHPSGYLLDKVHLPAFLEQAEPGRLGNQIFIYTPASAPWLKPRQCFVVTQMNFSQLVGGRAWRQFASTSDLVAGLRNPSLNFGADVRVTVHSRIVQPVLDMTLFFLGIPVVVARESRNIFVSIGSCLLVVGLFFLITLGSQSLGLNYLIAPAQAAWTPLILLVPLAVARSSPLSR
jgi:lipopolysaccharide export system permease protein